MPISHVCQLKPDHTINLPRLPPNAGLFRRTIRAIRNCMLVDLNSKRCKLYFRNNSGSLIERKRHINGPNSRIIHPLSAFNAWRENIMFVIYFVFLMLSSFHWAFVLVPKKQFLHSLLVARNAFFIANGLIKCFTGYYQENTNEFILKPKKILLNYFCWEFFIDLSFLRIDLWIYWLSDGQVDRTILFYVGLLQFWQFAYMINMRKHVLLVTECYDIPQKLAISVWTYIQTMFILHGLTCAAYYMYLVFGVSEHEANNQSWIEEIEADPFTNKTTLFMKYAAVFHVVSSNFFTSHSSIIKFHYLFENVFMSFVMMMGTLYEIWLMAYFMHIFDIINLSACKYETLQNYLKKLKILKKLPTNLRTKIDKYMEYKFQKNYYKENVILETLSENLRNEVQLHLCQSVIEHNHVLKKMPKAHIFEFIKNFQAEIFLENDFVCKRNELQEYIHFIGFGTVAVYDENGIELGHLKDGEDLGSYSSLNSNQSKNLVTAMTTEISYTFRMEKRLFEKYLETSPEIKRFIINRAKQKDRLYQKRKQKYYEKIIAGADILSQLKQGEILEKRKRRPKLVEN